MKCPHCKKEITLFRIAGEKGGHKSRRTLTKEQARSMVKQREIKRREFGR